MTLATLPVWLVTDRAGQPLPGMDARLSWERNSDGDQIILLHPRTDAERGYERFVGVVSLRTAGNQYISGKAQIIVSSLRILGMVIDGVAAGEPIGVDAGIVLVFTVPNHGLACASSSPGGPMRVAFRGRTDEPFELAVTEIQWTVSDTGDHEATTLQELLRTILSQRVIASAHDALAGASRVAPGS